jgi:AraC-like DNA-binding protein
VSSEHSSPEPPDPLSAFLRECRVVLNACGHQDRDPSATCDFRVIGDLEIIVFAGGTGTIETDRGRYVFTHGDIAVVPPMLVHAIDTPQDDPHDAFYFHLDIEPLDSRVALIERGLGGAELRRLCLDDFDWAHALAKRCVGDSSSGAPGAAQRSSTYAAALLSIVFAELLPAGVSRSPQPTTGLRSALSGIYTNLRRRIAVEDLAEWAGMSRSSLFTAFREHLGLAPMEAVWWIRLRRAELLLKTTTSTLAEIAEETGFSSPFHLSQRFKGSYGSSPQAFRRGTHVPAANWTHRHAKRTEVHGVIGSEPPVLSSKA